MATYSLSEVTGAPTPKRYSLDDVALPGEDSTPDDPGMLNAALIGAGRTFDKVFAGSKQLVYGVGSKFGSSSADKALDELKADQESKDRIYSGLQKKRPFATGIGESMPALAVTGGSSGATALSRVLFPALTDAGIGAASYGSAGERAGNAALNFATGSVGGVAGELLGRLVKPFTKGTTVTKTAEDAAERMGWTPTGGQRTGNGNILAVEDTLSQMPGGSGVFSQWRAKNQEAINRAAARAIGQDSPALTQDVLQAAKTAITGERGALLQTASADPANPVFGDAIKEARKALSGGSKELQSGKPAQVIDEFETFLANKGNAINGAEYQAWRTDLDQAKTAAFKAGDGKAASAYQKLKESLDAAVRTGNPEEWAGNDKLYSAYKMLTGKAHTVNEVTGDVNAPWLTSAYLNRFGDAAKRGAIDGPVSDIATVTKGFTGMREGSQTARREAFNSFVPWLLAPANYGAAKALTSPTMSNWMAYGLMSSNPALQKATIKGMRGAGLLGGMGGGSGLLNVDGY